MKWNVTPLILYYTTLNFIAPKNSNGGLKHEGDSATLRNEFT